MTLNGTQIHSIEVARLLGQTHQKVKQKIDSLRGRLTGFNPDGYDLTRNECQSLLQSYADGGRLDNQVLFEAANQFGVKIVFGSTEKLPPVTPIPAKPEPEKTKPTVQPVTKKQSTKELEKTETKLAYKAMFLVVALNGVFWQASHFADLEKANSPLSEPLAMWAAWGSGLGFECLALLLAIFSDKGKRMTWCWLIGFGVIAFFMNLSYYDFWQDANFTKFILSAAIPFSIVASTGLFLKNRI